ncbi:hypothetical protein HYPSUDRAFT_326749 [Hypholoma sublateritium FD-334 SS-4]|uniref:Uncharacterized protein n=1 Tax=Hypholoma sublateritium (strain FD-334 SS-4) TaxID=945553 RepID=A0A0D2LYN3_HYPSF|nr:hypothetical protein HYPSUDRAFT_326749 [Hypholoma sublateritium FD-334 SS-4]
MTLAHLIHLSRPSRALLPAFYQSTDLVPTRSSIQIFSCYSIASICLHQEPIHATGAPRTLQNHQTPPQSLCQDSEPSNPRPTQSQHAPNTQLAYTRLLLMPYGTQAFPTVLARQVRHTKVTWAEHQRISALEKATTPSTRRMKCKVFLSLFPQQEIVIHRS